MEELRRKQKLKRRLYSAPAVALLLIVTLFFLHGTYVVFQKKAESEHLVKALEIKSNTLKEQQIELTANISNLKTEGGFEKEIKEKYNVAKEGEHVVILVDKASTTTENGLDNRAWYERLWDAILAAL